MKKYFSLIVFGIFLVLIFAGCSSGGGTTNNYYIQPTDTPTTSPTTSPTSSPTTSPTTFPTISPSPTVSPSPSPIAIAIQERDADVIIDHTLQFTAIATMSDGSTQDVTGDVVWSPELSFFGYINDSGLYSTTWFGTDTISAQLGNLSDSTTVRVVPHQIFLYGSESYIQIGNTATYYVLASNGMGDFYDISNLAGLEVVVTGLEGVLVFDPYINRWVFTPSQIGIGQVTANYADLTSNVLALTTVPSGGVLINFVLPQGLTTGYLRVFRSDQVGAIANYRIEGGRFVVDYYGHDLENTILIEGGYSYRFQAISDDGLTDGWWPSLDPSEYGFIPVGWAYWVFIFTTE